MMTRTFEAEAAREYLEQSFQIDRLIQNKLDQMSYLRELEAIAEAAMSVSQDPKRDSDGLGKSLFSVEEIKASVADELTRLMEVKRDISLIIQGISSMQVRSVLEQRYICCRSWTDIAEAMACSQRQAYNIHNRGLQLVGSILCKKKALSQGCG